MSKDMLRDGVRVPEELPMAMEILVEELLPYLKRHPNSYDMFLSYFTEMEEKFPPLDLKKAGLYDQ